MEANQTVIYIDLYNRLFHYYTMPNGSKDQILHDIKPFKAIKFDEELYDKLTEAVIDFQSKYPVAQAQDTTIVLPNNAIFMDVITLPQIKDIKGTLDSTISGMFKDAKAFTFNMSQTTSNKQFVTYGYAGVKNDILTGIKGAMTNAKMVSGNITFAANAEANAVATLNSSLSKSTYLLMDIKESFTNIIYVFKGTVLGFGDLPFGYNILSGTKLAAEDMLFNHSVADLAVLNARERAKSKDLTIAEDNSEAVMEGEDFKDEFLSDKEKVETEAVGAQDESVDEYNPFANYDNQVQKASIKVLPKKQPRKLPKYMLREVPEDEKELTYENFRIFEKWALCYIQGNDNLRTLENPSGVYVNMPSKFDFLYDMVNREQTENEYKFESLGIGNEIKEVRENLEMYGGFFAKKVSTSKNF